MVSQFVNKEKKFYDKIQFNEVTDCPVCMEEFTDHCDIIQLSCSENHIYHSDCLKSWMKKQ